MVNASQLLYNLLSAKLKHRFDHCVDVLKYSISLMLFSIAQLRSVCPSEERSDIVKAAFDGLQTTLWKWITDPAVIGGSLFGGSILSGRLYQAEWEFKVDTCNLCVVCLLICFLTV